jgi:hypothetical protein
MMNRSSVKYSKSALHSLWTSGGRMEIPASGFVTPSSEANLLNYRNQDDTGGGRARLGTAATGWAMPRR